MAITINNTGMEGIEAGFSTLYTCTSPVTNSIIFSLIVSNNHTEIVSCTLKLTDAALNTVNIIQDSKISVGGSLALGKEMKIVLEAGDVLEIKPSDAGALDVGMSYIEIDPSVEYYGPPPWYGDIGFIFGVGSLTSVLDRFDFTSRAITTGYVSIIAPITQGAGTSNNDIGIIVGGNSTSVIKSVKFANGSQNSTFSSLMSISYYINASSNVDIHLTFGGYNGSAYMDTIQKGTFTAGETCTLFGNISGISSSKGADGNFEIALTFGGYSGGYIDTIESVEYATESNVSLWGNLRSAKYALSSASIEEKLVHQYDSATLTTTNIDTIDLASMGNSVLFGNLFSGNSEQGCIGNSTDVMFTAGENYNYSDIFTYATGGTATRITGLSNFDGESNRGMSGNS